MILKYIYDTFERWFYFVDPLAHEFPSWSPFAAMGDNTWMVEVCDFDHVNNEFSIHKRKDQILIIAAIQW